ncbi:MAG: TIR domain-containing protein [Cyanobacteria bacterium P01_F01_bin.53]
MQEEAIAQPEKVKKRTSDRIESALERERQPTEPVQAKATTKFINPPPAAAPSWFQNRHVETKLIADFIKDDSLRLMTVVGRGGVGKTAMVCRVLKALESGQLPDDLGALTVSGIVYLSPKGLRQVNLPHLYADLCKLLPTETSTALESTYQNPQASARAKMYALLSAFPQGKVVVLLDSFERVTDAESGELEDGELAESLQALLEVPNHSVKVIITTRVAPRSLQLAQPGYQTLLRLDEGLEYPHAENILREMDADGSLGLKEASPALLGEARKRTLGYPRALEALVAILSVDRTRSLTQLLTDTEKLLPDNVVEALVGEAFSNLDSTSQRVMQTLAILGKPVPAGAVDFLLQPYLPGINSGPLLQALENRLLVRSEAGQYYLPEVDRSYALQRLPEGTVGERDAESSPFSRLSLLHRAAEYYQTIRTPRESWKSIEDLAPQLAEIEARMAGGEYDVAASVLLEIEKSLSDWHANQLLKVLYEGLQGHLTEPTLEKATRINLNRVRQLIEPSAFELQQTLRGHSAPVTQLVWFHDGNTLASGGLDNIVLVWDANNGTLKKVLQGHDGPVLAIALTPDEKFLISASEDTTLKIWDIAAGRVLQTLIGHTNSVTGVKILPDGRIISTSLDRTLKIWDPTTGIEEFTLRGHTDRINALCVIPDDYRVVSAASDQTLIVWNILTRQGENKFIGHSGACNDVVSLDNGDLVASASEDMKIHIWSLVTNRQVHALEGPTAAITSLSVSSERNFLAAKSADGYIRIWRCDTWKQVALVSESSSTWSIFSSLSFSPYSSKLASLGENNTIIRIWKISFDLLRNNISTEESIRYTAVKIALLGDTGVGKTGLGWRLAYGNFREQSSTHGQRLWVINNLRTMRSDQTECEVVLWDLAGQPDYRLIHTLFLDDVDVGLLLFDPTNRRDPLQPVNFWLKHLCKPERSILIGARIDRGTPTLTPDELDEYCKHAKISGGYIGTSALSGEGLEELVNRIKKQVDWNDKPPTVSPQVFTTIKGLVLDLCKSQNEPSGDKNTQDSPLMMSPPELAEKMSLMESHSSSSFNYSQMMTAISHLAKHGYVSILHRSSGENVILLLPNLVNNLAASIALEARRTNFGSIDENCLLRGDYPFPELTNLTTEDSETLLDAAATLFLEHSLCFRETIKGKTFLVFPSLINQKRPVSQSIEMIDDVSYIISGSIETIYSTLAVQLGYTQEFERTYIWQDNAQYESGENEICGFRQIDRGNGEIEITLYYSSPTPDYTRDFFKSYCRRILEKHQLAIAEYQPLTCTNPSCQKLQERSTIINKIRDGETFHYCGYCGTKIHLATSKKTIDLPPVQEERLNQDQDFARLRVTFETALVRFKRRIDNEPAPTCFISYAWGSREHERWMHQLAIDLSNAGVDVVLDRWDNAEPGSSIARFISLINDCKFIIVVGTPMYKKKYQNKVSETGSVVAAEFDLIANRLLGTELDKKSILPLLRIGENIEGSLPEMLHGRTLADFRRNDQYFIQLFDIIVTVFGMSFRDNSIIQLRDSIANA